MRLSEINCKEIVAWLRDPRNDKHVRWQDEPYEVFVAELQDWRDGTPNKECLIIGYYFKQAGDMVPDPCLQLWIDGDQVVSGTIITCIGYTEPIDRPGNLEFVRQLCGLWWHRHFASRAEREVSDAR